MRSKVIKRSVVIRGHKTSVSLEDEFWQGLKEIALCQRATLSTMVADIDARRQHGNLSSAIRVFVLDGLRAPSSNGLEQRVDGPRRLSEPSEPFARTPESLGFIGR